MGLASFAMGGQGLGAGAKKGSVAAGGAASASDKIQAPQFSSGKALIARGDPTLNQKPGAGGVQGVTGTALPMGKSSQDGAPAASLKSGGKGVSGTSIPVGRQKL